MQRVTNPMSKANKIQPPLQSPAGGSEDSCEHILISDASASNFEGRQLQEMPFETQEFPETNPTNSENVTPSQTQSKSTKMFIYCRK